MIEIKRALSAKPGKGFYQACEDIQPARRFVVYAGEEWYPVSENVLAIACRRWRRCSYGHKQTHRRRLATLTIRGKVITEAKTRLLLFPPRWRVVGRHEAHGLDLVHQAIGADLVDVRGRQIERGELHLVVARVHDLRTV